MSHWDWRYINMIEINLLPAELKRKRKSSILPKGFKIPLEMVIGAGGGLLILLILVHIFLLFMNITKLAQHRSLKAQWEKILPDKKNVDGIISELRLLQTKLKSIEDITGTEKIRWSKKLNIISDNMPRGVWLKKIALSEDKLFIDGSAISKANEEMINIHNFASNLKKDPDFLSQLSDLELGSIQRRKVSNVDISDFLINAKLKKSTINKPGKK